MFGRTDHLVLAALTHRHGGNPQKTVRRLLRDIGFHGPESRRQRAQSERAQEARASTKIGAFPGVFPLESAAVIGVKALPWLGCSVLHLWKCTNLAGRSFGQRRRTEACGLIVLVTIFRPASEPFREPHKSTLLKHPNSNKLFWLFAYRDKEYRAADRRKLPTCKIVNGITISGGKNSPPLVPRNPRLNT
jgi:hypothetical protein